MVMGYQERLNTENHLYVTKIVSYRGSKLTVDYNVDSSDVGQNTHAFS